MAEFVGPYGATLGARDWTVASPFYPDVPGRLALVEEVNAIFESLMPRLADVLNVFHGVQYQRRQWEIIAGPFLTRYIRTILNRYHKLDQCVREDGVTRSIHLRRPADVTPVDTVHMINLSEVDAWNHEVCSSILRDFFPSVEIEERDVADDYRAEVRRFSATGMVRGVLERVRARRQLYINDMHASRALKLEFYLRSGQLWLTPRPGTQRHADRSGSTHAADRRWRTAAAPPGDRSLSAASAAEVLGGVVRPVS